MGAGAPEDRAGNKRKAVRTRSRVGWWLGLIVVVAVASVALHQYTQGPLNVGPVRHVIVVSLDTTRADHFGCYGNTWIRTPNLDALAAESILFTNYMTVVTTTLASHTSLLTGKYPQTHGVPRNGFMVSRENVMLAEILKEAGFHTAGFLGSFALDRRFDFAQGFDHFDESFDILVGSGEIDQNQRSAAAVTDAAIDYLEQDNLPPNLFLFVHYFDPHAPYTPPAPYDTMYGVGDGPHAVRVENHPALLAGGRAQREQEKLLRYAGEVSYMDEHIGRLLDYLRARGILDQSILIVTSDHGENLGEVRSRPFNHGATVYEVETRAVGIVRLPGAAQGGTTCGALTASVDILPALTRYLGLPTPAGIDGEALDLLNLAAAAEPRSRFAEATQPWQQVETDPRWFNLRKPRCVRRGTFKYIETQYRGTRELYDLSSDPYERHNLLAAPTPHSAALAAELRAALQAWNASANPLPTRFECNLRDETIRRLQSLGYLGSDDDGGDEEK